MEPEIRDTINRDIGGDHQRISSVDTEYFDVTFKHLLLPVWISAYLYAGQTYRFLVNARIVATETGESLAAASEPVAAANLISLSSDAVVLRSKKDAVYRSALLPGWGQLYNRDSGKAIIFSGAEVLVLGGALAAHLMGASSQRAVPAP